MNFTNLQRDLPPPKWDATEFYACVVRASFLKSIYFL
jgi:hypothetical protein